MKVALLTAGFGPYRVPLWNALADCCELSIVFLSAKEKIRSWDADCSKVTAQTFVLESRQLFVRGMDWSLNWSYWSVKKQLDAIEPEVLILGGYESPGYWAARSWAKEHNVPTVLWMESTLLSTRTKGFHLIERMKALFIRDCSAYYVPGRLSADYLAYFGARREKITVGYGVCDVDKFSSADKIGDGRAPVLLYVGRLVNQKGIPELIAALEKIVDLPWKLLVAGDGPLRNQMVELSAKTELGSRIEMLGYVQQNDLSEVYRRADIFLFPTLNEAWGLVVNEALLSGLYVVGSNRAAACLELVEPGLNGEVIDPFDKHDFIKGLRRALERAPFDREKIRQTVTHISPQREALQLMKAVSGALSSKGTK